MISGAFLDHIQISTRTPEQMGLLRTKNRLLVSKLSEDSSKALLLICRSQGALDSNWIPTGARTEYPAPEKWRTRRSLAPFKTGSETSSANQSRFHEPARVL